MFFRAKAENHFYVLPRFRFHRAPYPRAKYNVMAPRNLRKRQPADSDDEEDGAGAVGLQSLQERIEDARTLIKNRAKNKVRRQKQDLVGLRIRRL
jgi:hypothetical protein